MTLFAAWLPQGRWKRSIPRGEKSKSPPFPGGRTAAAPQRTRHVEHPALRYGRRRIPRPPRPPAAPVRAAAGGGEGRRWPKPTSSSRCAAKRSYLLLRAFSCRTREAGGEQQRLPRDLRPPLPPAPPLLSSPRGRRTNAALGAVPTRPSPSRAPMAAEMAAEPPPPPSPRPEGSGPSAGRGGERLGDAGVPFPLASPRGWLGCRIPAFQEARNVGWFPFLSDSLAAEPVFRQNLSRFGCRVLEHSRPPSAHSGAFLIFQLVFIHRIIESKGGRALKASQPQAPMWAACPCQVRLPRPPSFAHPETLNGF